jgi:hypothetical protein
MTSAKIKIIGEKIHIFFEGDIVAICNSIEYEHKNYEPIDLKQMIDFWVECEGAC